MEPKQTLNLQALASALVLVLEPVPERELEPEPEVQLEPVPRLRVQPVAGLEVSPVL